MTGQKQLVPFPKGSGYRGDLLSLSVEYPRLFWWHNKRQIEPIVAGRRVEEIHPTPIDATIGLVDVADLEAGFLEIFGDDHFQLFAQVVAGGPLDALLHRDAGSGVHRVEGNSNGVLEPQDHFDGVLSLGGDVTGQLGQVALGGPYRSGGNALLKLIGVVASGPAAESRQQEQGHHQEDIRHSSTTTPATAMETSAPTDSSTPAPSTAFNLNYASTAVAFR